MKPGRARLRSPRNRQSGSVFVVTLAVLAALVAVLAAAASSQRARYQGVLARIESSQARWAAQSALHRALAELSLFDVGDPTSLQDDWARLGQNGSEEFTIEGGSFRIQILDASAFVNINTAPQAQLERLPLTQEQIDSLLDWREPGNFPRPQGGKDEYYGNLPNPYNTGLSRLTTIDELLNVRGFTGRAIFTPQTNVVSTATIQQGSLDSQPTLFDLITVDSYTPQTTPTGQTKLNVNNVNPPALIQRGIPPDIAAQIFTRRPHARLGDVVALAGANRQAQRTILDELTISGAARVEGRINLNTADEPVLSTVPGLTPDIVQSILTRQVQGFERLSDILDVPGMTGNTLVQSIDSFSVQSTGFRVRVEGSSGTAKVWLEAFVEIVDGQPRIARVEEAIVPNMPLRWRWPEVAPTQTPLEEVRP
ncbi:MAG: helix-hairpin-helix domain-containing protein [Fimbriimonadaceae bacterium]